MSFATILPHVCWRRDTGVKIVFQKKPMCKGLINIKTNSNDKLRVLILFWAVLIPLFPHIVTIVIRPFWTRGKYNEMTSRSESLLSGRKRPLLMRCRTKSLGTNCPLIPWESKLPWKEGALWLIPNCSLGASPERWFFRGRWRVWIRGFENSVVGRVNNVCFLSTWLEANLSITGSSGSCQEERQGSHLSADTDGPEF